MSGFDREPMRGEMTVPNPADDLKIEIMGRGICAAHDFNPDLINPNTGAPSWMDYADDLQDALAALHAAGYAVRLMEPTDEMVERALDAYEAAPGLLQGKAMRAALRAALGDKP